MENEKKVTNPDGRKGGEKHQTLIQKIIDLITKNKQDFRKEAQVKTDDNKSRYADVASLDENGEIIEYHQVGKQNKNGTPVARERKAIEEIEKATGKKVIFHPYNIIVALAIIFGMVLVKLLYY